MSGEQGSYGATTIKDSIKTLTDMKDDTVLLALSVITMTVMIITLLIYFYVSGTSFSDGLRVRDCKNMDTMFATLNGKIRSIDTHKEQYKYSLRDYYIKSAYNACSGGIIKMDM